MSQNERNIDIDGLVKTIISLNHEYISLNGKQPRTLIAVGGSAMALHGIRSVSADIDLYSPEDGFMPIAEQVEAASGLRIDVTSKTVLWGVLDIADIERDAKVIKSAAIDGFSVDIAAISPETLFVIKASTLREKDRDDLPLILPFTSIQAILARADELVPRQNEVVAEDMVMNLISELQLVTLESPQPDWFKDSPNINRRFMSLIENSFNVELTKKHARLNQKSIDSAMLE